MWTLLRHLSKRRTDPYPLCAVWLGRSTDRAGCRPRPTSQFLHPVETFSSRYSQTVAEEGLVTFSGDEPDSKPEPLINQEAVDGGQYSERRVRDAGKAAADLGSEGAASTAKLRNDLANVSDDQSSAAASASAGESGLSVKWNL
jgi:hypothetical protein